MLARAPERVREENSRSLKNLNAYIDNLSQNQGTEAVQLKFYIAEKSNNKSKKYIFFDI